MATPARKAVPEQQGGAELTRAIVHPPDPRRDAGRTRVGWHGLHIIYSRARRPRPVTSCCNGRTERTGRDRTGRAAPRPFWGALWRPRCLGEP